MRLGVVQGRVVLSAATPELIGTTLLIVEPVTASNLRTAPSKGGGKALVVADKLSPAVGQLVAFVEGREAANPYWPNNAPVDAYCSLIVDGYDYRPPASKT